MLGLWVTTITVVPAVGGVATSFLSASTRRAFSFGEATIFRPKEGGGTVVVARVLIEEWPAIAAAAVRR